MRLISWNVNGIRACQKTGNFDSFFDNSDADFFVFKKQNYQKR